MRAYLVVMICLVLGAGVVGEPAGDGATARRATNEHSSSAPAPQARRTRVVGLSVDFPPPAAPAEREAVVAMSGAELAVAVTGEPDAKVVWRLVHAKLVVERGAATLDEQGQTRLSIVTPSVRHRTACTLVMRHGNQVSRRRVVVLPEAMAPAVRRRIGDLDVGVRDDTGKVQTAMREQDLSFTDLDSRLRRDAFAGGLVVLAGFDRAEDLSRVCGSLESRIRDGLSVVVVNPPVGWSGWGIETIGLETEWRSPVRLAEGFAMHLQSDDFGTGPWRSLLVGDDAEKLLWTDPPATEGDGGEPLPPRPLVLTRTIGSGTVIVAGFPAMDDTADDAVGRAMLTDCLHWIRLVKSVPSKEPETCPATES